MWLVTWRWPQAVPAEQNGKLQGSSVTGAIEVPVKLLSQWLELQLTVTRGID